MLAPGGWGVRYEIPSAGPASSAVCALLSPPQTAQSGEREGYKSINPISYFLHSPHSCQKAIKLSSVRFTGTCQSLRCDCILQSPARSDLHDVNNGGL